MMTKGITQHYDTCVGIWKNRKGRKGRESMTTQGRQREDDVKGKGSKRQARLIKQKSNTPDIRPGATPKNASECPPKYQKHQ